MQQSSDFWLWLGPYVILLLVMVYAMMEFTVALLLKAPPHKRPPVSAAELRTRILELKEKASPYELVTNSTNDLQFRWQLSSATSKRLVQARQSTTHHIYLLLYEDRHELCVAESASSFFYFFGLSGWIPRISASAGYSAGPPGMTPFIRQLSAVTLAAGWTFRPVILPFQATMRGGRLLGLLTPPPLRHLSSKTVWGILYPLTYALAFMWFFTWGGAEIRTAHNLLIFLAISAIWWSFWALLAWTICGFPRFWKRKR